MSENKRQELEDNQEKVKDINELNNEEKNTDYNEKKENKTSIIMEWARAILIAIILAFLIKTFIFEPTRISGSSMLNTLHDNDRVLVNKITMKFSPIKRKDIIVMKFDENKDYIKRIIGLPGEYIQIIDGKVYINGKVYEEPYINQQYTETINGFEWKLGHNQYFVMGDNRLPNGSTDSRVFGPIELDRIKGVANFRFYPFSGFGLLK
ncbi:signal peptidase I [Helcococcus ovis]|uniref:signal peptidase I n=1 Tax=Helcococcus TaxID=31983 RepID=UPI001FD63946|nr:signal peptidase I [Helcococcus ovis]WNZ01061.1 signal peptidase I [Helcococcus ovis]